MKLVELMTVFRFNPTNNSYYQDMDGDGVLCMAVDILPTEFAKEVNIRLQFFSTWNDSKVGKNCTDLEFLVLMKKASQHFGDILSEFVGSLASMTVIADLPAHLKRACISYRGELTSLYEYIPRMRKSDPEYVLLPPLIHITFILKLLPLGLFSKLYFNIYTLQKQRDSR